MSDLIDPELIERKGGRACGPSVFTFGAPEPVLGRRDILDYIECWTAGRWYEPPVSVSGLARAFRVGPHHESAIRLKVRLLASMLEPTRLLTLETFRKMALDHQVFGNAYAQRVEAVTGRALRVEAPLAKYMRRGIVDGEFFQVWGGGMFGVGAEVEHAFEPGSVLQLSEPDINQEIYGLPEYLSALQSAFLNESATIFRRRYYENGSHAGFFLYMTDTQVGDEDVDAIRKALRDSKGPGNFKNVFIHAPNGKPDGLKLVPISEVTAKDEFLGIKGASRDDVLAAHRVPPQILGIVPANGSGFGDVAKATDVFVRNEIEPLKGVFLALNDWLGEEAVRFRPWEPMATAAPLPAGSAPAGRG